MVALHHDMGLVRRRRSRDHLTGRPFNWRMLLGLSATAAFWAWIVLLAPHLL